MLDRITGMPCANCESAPAWLGPFCSNECRDEYEGTGAYAEPATLFPRAGLIQAEALRQHKAAQLPGQIDIWDACAEVAAEAAAVPFVWPLREGELFDVAELRGQLVLA